MNQLPLAFWSIAAAEMPSKYLFMATLFVVIVTVIFPSNPTR